MPFHATGAVVAAPPWFGAAADAQLDANTNAAGVVCSVSTAACPQVLQCVVRDSGSR